MENILKNLIVDMWYKALLLFGAIISGYALTFETKGISNQQALLLGMAMFCLGLGEWKNHKIAVKFKPANMYTGPAGIMQYPIRKADGVGLILDMIGIVLIIIFILVSI